MSSVVGVVTSLPLTQRLVYFNKLKKKDFYCCRNFMTKTGDSDFKHTLTGIQKKFKLF